MMKLKIRKDELINGLQMTQKGMSTKNTIPHLNGYLLQSIESDPPTLKIQTYDLEMGVSYVLPCDIEKPGEIVVPASFFDIVKKMPLETIYIDVDHENLQIKIESGQVYIELKGLDPSEYPHLPRVEEFNSFSLPQQVLRQMIHETSFAVSKEETKPAFTGVLFRFSEEDKMDMVATDSFRLAWSKEKIINDDGIRGEFIIPQKTVNQLQRILQDDDSIIKLSLSQDYFLCESGQVKVVSKLIKETFPNLEQVIPKNYQSKIYLDRKSFAESMDRAVLLASEETNNIVKLNIREDNMEITSHSPQTGKFKEELAIDCEGDNISIALNAKFLIEVLKIMQEAEVELEFTGSYSPVILRPWENERYFHLILPVRAI